VRDKKRYLLMHGDPDETVKVLKVYFGQVGYWQASPKVVYRKDKVSVVRVRNAGMQVFRAANFLTGNDIVLVSGSVRKLLKSAMGL